LLTETVSQNGSDDVPLNFHHQGFSVRKDSILPHFMNKQSNTYDILTPDPPTPSVGTTQHMYKQTEDTKNKQRKSTPLPRTWDRSTYKKSAKG
jgi:hypothetical protein